MRAIFPQVNARDYKHAPLFTVVFNSNNEIKRKHSFDLIYSDFQ
jgi:hypothetical protein